MRRPLSAFLPVWIPSRGGRFLVAALTLVASSAPVQGEGPAVFLPEARIGPPLPAGSPLPGFGHAVAVAGDTMVVGADIQSGPAPNSGAAYVYVRTGSGWTLQQRLEPPALGPRNWYGRWVAISGDTVVVGAPAGTAVPNGEGRAYVFVRSGTAWTHQQTLQAPDGEVGDTFGNCVSIDGDTVVVGAQFDDTAGGASAGSAHVFVRSDGSWSHQQGLEAPDGAAHDNFGYRVSVHGDTAAVGADDADTGGGANAGAVYMFVRWGAGWSLHQKLTASDGAAGDFFSTVSLLGDTLMVGADLDDTAGGVNAGSVYVFSRLGGQWTETQKLTASDGGTDDRFGFSVSLSDQTVVIGALSEVAAPYTRGAAYVFSRSDTAGWGDEHKLVPDRGDGPNGMYAQSVSAWGDTLAVGSPQAVTPGSVSGAVYVYRTPRETDLSLGLADAPDPVMALTPLTYSIAVQNLGPAPALAVSVAVDLPAGVVFASTGGAGWTCAETSGVVTCTRPGLAVGAAPVLSIVVTPTAAATLICTAGISHAGTDPEPANDSATEVTKVTPPGMD
jgi:hypothetical protein